MELKHKAAWLRHSPREKSKRFEDLAISACQRVERKPYWFNDQQGQHHHRLFILHQIKVREA
jgi:hypothetical protein